jgi:ferrous iron transport protein B
LLIGAFFSENKAMYMFLFTLISWVVALLAAKFLRLTVLKGPATPFVMELPPYRFPTLQGLAIHTWERTWQYIKKAGTVILGISILLWAMMSYPELPATRQADFEQQRQHISAAVTPAILTESTSKSEAVSEEALTLRHQITVIDRLESEQALRYSIAGKIGLALEPVSTLAGFEWRTNIALVGGFAAKEVIISTLGTAYSMGDVKAEASDSLGQRLTADPNWNKVVAVSALIFIMFYAPCFVTVVCIAKEAGHWGWAVFSVSFNTIFAFLLATAVYQIGIRIG